MKDFLVTVKDARCVKYCKNGTKEFFKRYNLDWDEFVKVGVSSKKLLDTGDAMAAEVVEVAHGRRK